MDIFYTPDISGDTLILDETESRHCVKVMRLTTGDNIALIDGRGGKYTATIVEPNPKKCAVKVISRETEQSRNFRIHIAIAPTKNIDRTEWFLEKATEFGIDEVTLLLCEHSERKIVNYERLEKIMISAIKQSVKATLPTLNEMTTFSDLLKNSNCCDRFIAHCEDGEKPHLMDVVKPQREVLVMIGPEGDFSIKEIELSRKLGVTEVSLGSSRLRTETAGLAACHIVNLINESSIGRNSI